MSNNNSDLIVQTQSVPSPLITIHGIGCALIDYVYSPVSFDSPTFSRYRSHKNGDGGLVPGGLVFADDLERFAGQPAPEIVNGLSHGQLPTTINIGGPAIVALVQAAQLLHSKNAEVKFSGLMGNDATANHFFSKINATPVDVSTLKQMEGVSPCTYVLSDPAWDSGCGERTFINTIGVAGEYLPSMVPSGFFSANIVLFGATALVPALHAQLGPLLQTAKQHGCLTVVTTVYDFLSQKQNPDKCWLLGEDDATYQLIDLLITDREEAQRLSGCADIPDAMTFFMDHGAGACIITNGPEPFFVASAGKPFSPLTISQLPVSSCVAKELHDNPERKGDTTGCGDNFAGGVIASLAMQMAHGVQQPYDIIDACSWGVASGGFACFYMGGMYHESFPGQKAGLVERYYREYKEQLQKTGCRSNEIRPKIVVFGAGNIGRSFIGQLFSCGGYEVVFVDVNEQLVRELNSKRRYRVVIKTNDRPDEIIWVDHVRAVCAHDFNAVVSELVDATCAATAVGKNALEHIVPSIAKALERRLQMQKGPLDLILAENVRDCASIVEAGLRKLVSSDFPFNAMIGLVETSIGKMVPIMRQSDSAEDLLQIFSEPYNTLIVDCHAFKNPIPDVAGIIPVGTIAAYVDRKLFVHNLGHAAVAYLGYAYDQSLVYIWQALEIPEIKSKVKQCMQQAAIALNCEYPDDLPLVELNNHIDDLLHRFENGALGDTIFRVGRDLYRKLDKNDRIFGALLLAKKHNVPCNAIARVAVAACRFTACDEQGNMFENDRKLIDRLFRFVVEKMMTDVCGLSRSSNAESLVVQEVLEQVA